MSGRCSRLTPIQQTTLWLIKVAGVIVWSFSFFCSSILVRLHTSRQSNNTQKLDTVVAYKVKPCKIALTEPEGKAVILRSPSTTHPASPCSGPSAWRGNYITRTSSQLWWIPSPEKTGQPDLHLWEIRSSDYNASYLPPLDKSSTGAQKQSRPDPLQLII